MDRPDKYITRPGRPARQMRLLLATAQTLSAALVFRHVTQNHRIKSRITQTAVRVPLWDNWLHL